MVMSRRSKRGSNSQPTRTAVPPLPPPVPVSDAPPPPAQPENPPTPTPSPDPGADAKENREARQFRIDTWVKVLQMAALVGSGIWAVMQYREQHEKDRVQKDEVLSQQKEAAKKEEDQRERALRLKFYES